MTRQELTLERNRSGHISYINCYDLAVSAGTGEPWVDAAYKTRLEIPGELVPERAHFCVRVNGRSMEPAYRDGDIVFVERTEAVHEGETGIFFLNGDGYIKRLGHGELLSLNPEYGPIALAEVCLKAGEMLNFWPVACGVRGQNKKGGRPFVCRLLLWRVSDFGVGFPPPEGWRDWLGCCAG